MSNHPDARRSLVGRINSILLTFLSGEQHSVTEVARMTGLPVSTTHRLLADLCAVRILDRAADGRYHPGLPLRRLGSGPWPMPTLEERAPHVLQDVSDATRRRARLGVLCGRRVMYMEKRVSADVVTSFSPGATLPAHATAAGKALLAFAPRETVLAAARCLTTYTSSTIDTAQELHRALETTRMSRLAVSRSELRAGDCAIATPVFGAEGRVLAALELQVLDLKRDIQVGRVALMIAAASLSRELAFDLSDRTEDRHSDFVEAVRPGAMMG
jgi:DNA-binding IclR family transcriptional regulator